MTSISRAYLDSKTLALEGENVPQFKAFQPFQIVSLFDMLQVWAYPFYEMTYQLRTYLLDLQYNLDRRGKDEKTKYVDEKDQRHARLILGKVEHICEPFGMELTLRRVHSALNAAFTRPPCTLEKLLWETKEIEGAIRSDLLKVVWMHIPLDKAEYHEEARKNRKLPSLLNERATRRFPKANKEITKAANCYATGSNTACVFHLMRAAEHGMRALAAELNVSFVRSPQTPIELRTWGEVITGITSAINAKPNAKTPIEAKKLELYNKAANQLQIFKDAWRDVVMHNRERKDYLEGETKDLMNSVCTFIEELAERFKEKK